MEVVKKWVKALRSGKYKRGSGHLRKKTPTGIRYCCLGVLCDITPGVVWTDEYDDVEAGTYRAVYGGSGNGACLPEGVMQYAGMGTQRGYIPTRKGMDILDDINDSGKYSFNQIADIIEKHWEKL